MLKAAEDDIPLTLLGQPGSIIGLGPENAVFKSDWAPTPADIRHDCVS